MESIKMKGLVNIEKSKENFASLGEEERKVQELSDKINSLIDSLIEQRERLGLSQRDLAKLVGLKQPAVARFERLEVIPRLDTFLIISKALNANIYLEYYSEAVTKEIKGMPYSTNYQNNDAYSFSNGALILNTAIGEGQA